MDDEGTGRPRNRLEHLQGALGEGGLLFSPDEEGAFVGASPEEGKLEPHLQDTQIILQLHIK